ncbi:flagellar filament capping protein FliD [Clostridium drakei]|uniref:Flagellar hook-associated protein 2 n=1 Tax=Clostridium drakei TaxID=332101 RepID=A0A2U8DMM6_9CLOT|nr:flagellar filament capping protein FliD [Clostridium drakei]AWI03671.1 hypothetical protein B9W14_03955 [Clostridium drakei]
MSSVSGVSSSSATAASSKLRVTGQASGIDVDAAVKQMMSGENAKLDKLKQERQYTQWKQEAYRDIIKDIRDLRDSSFLSDSPDETNMISSKSLTGTSVIAGSATSSNSSQSTLVNGTSLPGAATGTYVVTVNQMAKTARLPSSALKATTQVTTKVNGADVINNVVNDATTTSKLSDINSNMKTQLKFVIDNHEIVLDNSNGDKTVNDLIYAINNTKDSAGNALSDNYKVGFSELNHKVIIETRSSGAEKNISIHNEGVGLSGLGIGTSDGTTTATGQDAKLTITAPGESASEVTKSSNTFTIDNMTYSILKDPAATLDVNGHPTPYTETLTVKADSKGAVDKIKAFITKYNKLVDKIYTMANGKKDYDYKPLTDSQKESMTDEQIKTWETKAKGGILSNENELDSLLNNMRRAFTDKVQSSGLTLQDIGLDTYGFDSSSSTMEKPGQIKIANESKLREALETKGDQVMNFFQGSPDESITDSKQKYNNTGVFQRLSDTFRDNAVTADSILLKKAGYDGSTTYYTNELTKQLTKEDSTIKDMAKRLNDKEESYYQKFSKLETAMTRLNSQASWLSQQLSK